MKVTALRDVAYLHERVENGRCVVGEQVLPAVTILDAQLCEREPTGDLGDAPPAPDGAPDALDAGPPLRVALR